MNMQPIYDLARPVRWFLYLCVALEGVSLISGVLGLGYVRGVLAVLGGFSPALFFGGEPLFWGQTFAMFVTTTLLHGDVLHLFMNMLGLVWLGQKVSDRVGSSGFCWIWVASAIGSGLFYLVLSFDLAPMVGASGVVFGLLGAVAAWELLDRMSTGQELNSYWQTAVVFLVINAVMALVSPGLAWQAHLGGLVFGALAAYPMWRRPVAPSTSAKTRPSHLRVVR